MQHDPMCDRKHLDPVTCQHCTCIALERARYVIEQASLLEVAR